MKQQKVFLDTREKMFSVRNPENQAKTLKIPYPTFEKLIFLESQFESKNPEIRGNPEKSHP